MFDVDYTYIVIIRIHARFDLHSIHDSSEITARTQMLFVYISVYMYTFMYIIIIRNKVD